MTDKPGNKTDGWRADESIVSRAYGKLAKAEPPAHLDEKILAEARRAAASLDSTVIRVQRWRKWTLPAALAATVVFAIPLVVRVFENASPEFTAADVSAAKMNDRTTEPGLVESDRTVAELTYSEPPASILNTMQGDTIAPADTTALALERPDREVSPAREQLRQGVETEAAAMSAGAPSPESTAPPAPAPVTRAGTIPAQSRSGIVPDSEPATTDDSFAAAARGLDDRASSASFRDDISEPDPANAALASAAQPEARLGQGSGQAMTSAGISRARTESITTTDAGIGEQSADYPAATTMAAYPQQDAKTEKILTGGGGVMEPQPWLDKIAAHYRDGRVPEARRELGSFLTSYPGYDLPDGFPLGAEEAIFEDVTTGETGKIVPEAAAWLRGIGLMAQRGEIDQARTQLARFFRIYPDYPLPEGFPLTREDAQPIER